MTADAWDAIGAVSTSVGSIVVCITAVLIFFQIREMATARMLEALSRIFDGLTVEHMSEARRYVLNEKLPEPGQVPKDAYSKMHKVWVSFDNLGILVERNMIPDNIALAMFSPSIIACWRKLEPYILHERKVRDVEYQIYFERLYHRSIEYRNCHGLKVPNS